MPTALTIAGSDSGAGAGLQADLKTFAAHGVSGVCAVTAVTAQNAREIRSIHEIPADIVASQIDAVAEGVEIHAVKIGMLSGAGIVRTVAERLERLSLRPVVLDPVMLASSGRRLLSPEALEALRSMLLSRVDVVTPNADEAGVLAGLPVRSVADARRAAEAIRRMGPRAVVVTGGHLDLGDVVDVVLDDSGCHELRGPRIDTPCTHGTGCTFAAAVAANLAFGRPLRTSADLAKRYVTGALHHGLSPGHAPLDHFWARDR